MVPPNATKPRAQARKKTKANSPGPSNVAQEKPSSKRAPAIHPDSDDNNDNVAAGAENAKPGPKPKPRSKASNVANGQQDQKGQEKATNSKSNKKPPVHDDVMEVDQGEGEVNVRTTSHSAAAGMNNIHVSSDAKTRKELERWKQKARDVRFPLIHLLFRAYSHRFQLEIQRDTLSKQLEELFQVRKTEPEQVLEQLQIQYDERAKSMRDLITCSTY